MTLTNQQWCSECERSVNPNIIVRPSTFHFKGEAFTIDDKVMVCPKCETELADENTDNEVMNKLVEKYMERHDLTFADIRATRQQYGFSMEVFAKILGWSKATVVRYESGNFIPDTSHMAIIKQLRDNPENIEFFYKQNKYKFNEKQQEKIASKIQNIDSEVVEKGLFHLLNLNYKLYQNSIHTGYLDFLPEKLANMVVFFSKSGVLKTKLMKLLWYSDFINFKRNLNSISGLPYIRLQHGPVPKDYGMILTTLEKNNYINSDEQGTGDYIAVIIKSQTNFKESLFSNDELEVLNYVNRYFHHYGSIQISEFSHNEKGWEQTNNHQIIPYSYAEDLNIG